MRMRGRQNFRRGVVTAMAVVWGLSAVSCESMPMRTYRGAQYYAEGSDSLRRGESARAIEELSRAVELVPHASEIQNHLGLAYWAGGQPEQAHIAFDRAIELDCDNLEARQNRRVLEGGASYGG